MPSSVAILTRLSHPPTLDSWGAWPKMSPGDTKAVAATPLGERLLHCIERVVMVPAKQFVSGASLTK